MSRLASRRVGHRMWKGIFDMEELIEALTIMLKHGNVSYPTHCQHDELHIYPNSMDFTDDEMKRLDELGFMPNGCDGFMSFKYGSC